MATEVYSWTAPSKRREQSHMAHYIKFINRKYELNLSNWDELYQWSISQIDQFWQSVAEFSNIAWHSRSSAAFWPSENKSIKEAGWFKGARLNFCENLLPKTHSNQKIVSWSEQGRRQLSSNQLRQKVFQCAESLRNKGVGKGDRVAGVLVNDSEAIVCMLAVAAVGGVWSSCSPDFGVEGIVDRLGSISPSLVFFNSRYHYNGKEYEFSDTMKECLSRLANDPIGIVVDFHQSKSNSEFESFDHLLQESESKVLAPGYKFEYASLEFNDPLYIMFSSGTTGKPKSIVHAVGRVLLQHKKELQLHCDIHEGDSMLFFTTCGWMMWNWMVSALSVGCDVVTYDGSPAYGRIDRLWQIVEEEQVSVVGTSPKYIDACINKAAKPSLEMPFIKLKSILTTGSPLLPEHYQWLYENVKKDVHIASISGGTDILSCFMLGNPLKPVINGRIQGAGLGMNIAAINSDKKIVFNEKAELVCLSPFVSAPVKFLNDPEGNLYTQAYFDDFGEQIWKHGDYIEMGHDGSIVVHGRSDATLNPGGVRIGTSELYRALSFVSGIEDSIAVGFNRDNDVEVLLFVKMMQNCTFSSELEREIKATIRKNLTPRHVPSRIFCVKDIPYTRSGKKVEVAVKKAIHGERIDNLNALANPESMEVFISGNWSRSTI